MGVVYVVHFVLHRALRSKDELMPGNCDSSIHMYATLMPTNILRSRAFATFSKSETPSFATRVYEPYLPWFSNRRLSMS